MGEFQIRTSNSVLSRKDNVVFILHATVKNDDYPAFDRHYRNHKNKVRDQVVTATRLVPIEDYDDPELKKFRRRLLLRLRRALPELPIADVYISDFALSVEVDVGAAACRMLARARRTELLGKLSPGGTTDSPLPSEN